jgi:hypothetical protein
MVPAISDATYPILFSPLFLSREQQFMCPRPGNMMILSPACLPFNIL